MCYTTLENVQILRERAGVRMIQKDCVILRAMEERDFDLLFRMINSPEIEKALGSFTLPVNENRQREWMKNYRDTREQIRWMIELVNGVTIGVIMLYDIDMKNGTAEVGYKLMAERENRMPGDIDTALQAVLEYGFLELRLHCIYAHSLSDNLPSERLLLRNGFQKEGTERQRIYQGGTYVDRNVYSILSEEFLPASSAN